MRGKSHTIEVWGDFACFSRPDGGKAERFSYPCPPPSAARGMFDAIYCKGWDRCTGEGQFYWQVERIELLAEPAYIALRRNEVKDKIQVPSVEKWMVGKGVPQPIWADGDKAFTGADTKGRTQRQTMALRGPRYRLRGHVVARRGFEDRWPSFDEQFKRRATQGKCFHQPFLGCREFVSFFRYVESPEAEPAPVDYSQELGFMVYDIFDLRKVNDWHARPFISLFQAKIEHGVLTVPAFESDLVLKPDIAERSVG